MEKFTPLATNFTLPPGLTGWTNFTSGVAKARRRIGEVGIITFDVIKACSEIFELYETSVLIYNNLLLLFQNASFRQNETAFV